MGWGSGSKYRTSSYSSDFEFFLFFSSFFFMLQMPFIFIGNARFRRATVLYIKVSTPKDDRIPKMGAGLKSTFQILSACAVIYNGSFFPKTFRDWNALPDSLKSSTTSAEDFVADES